MGEGRKKGTGGGGNPLNFKVVGNPQPTNPKLNTIWLNTDVKITGYHFASEQPEEMAKGEVWISTGTASQVAFNVLKKGTVMVYPLDAKQMLEDGTLADVTAKSWQNGEWVDWWDGHLYYQGNMYTEYTGGWEGKALYRSSDTTWDPLAPVISNSDGVMHVYFDYGSNIWTTGAVLTSKDIDLTGYSKITLSGYTLYHPDGLQKFGAYLVILPYSATHYYDDALAKVAFPTSQDKIELDISSITGTYRVGIGFARGGSVGGAYISEIQLS